MPVENPNFDWRVRVDIRSGVDMPMNSNTPHKMPSCYVELTWSDQIYYETIDPVCSVYTVIC